MSDTDTSLLFPPWILAKTTTGFGPWSTMQATGMPMWRSKSAALAVLPRWTCLKVGDIKVTLPALGTRQ
jgi:hypothetical protein